MYRPLLRSLFLSALSAAALTSCHISSRGVDFSPLTDRFEPALDDEVMLEGDTSSVSTPVATPPGVAFNAPAAADATAPIPEPKPIAEPAPALATAPATKGGAYVVKAGDTLGAIARRHNSTVAQLCTANGLQPTSTLQIGQKIVIPAAGAGAAVAKAAGKPAAPKATQPAKAAKTKAGKASGKTHTVKAGETLYAIARKNGVSPAALMQANKLTPQTAGKLSIGTTLTIPAK